MHAAAPSPLQQAGTESRGAGRRRPGRLVHCCVLAESRYLAQAQPAGMMRALARAGCRVTLRNPEAGLLDVADAQWLDSVDLVIARGRSTELLARLSAAEAAGVPTLNSRRAIDAVLDKAHMAACLHAAGVRTPSTWIGGIEQVRRSVPPSAFPVILKPVFGDNCRGIVVADTPAELARVAWNEPCVIAQNLLAGGGFDLKLYAIGDRVWAVRKPSALRPEPGPVTLLPLRPGWRELALRCGALFGLQLFGVDCIEAGGELQVIEVNDFPNYSGVPEADFLLARHVQLHARGEAHS